MRREFGPRNVAADPRGVLSRRLRSQETLCSRPRDVREIGAAMDLLLTFGFRFGDCVGEFLGESLRLSAESLHFIEDLTQFLAESIELGIGTANSAIFGW